MFSKKINCLELEERKLTCIERYMHPCYEKLTGYTSKEKKNLVDKNVNLHTTKILPATMRLILKMY